MRKIIALAFPALCAAAWIALRAGPAGAQGLDAAELLPGVDLSELTPGQKEIAARVARDEFCYCGCPHTLAQCLRTHKQCRHGPRMAKLVVRLAAGGMQQGEILRQVAAYYGSFEKVRRARLDVTGYGPPLGSEKAPVTLVEFSDFTCPYCQVLKPQLDEFVKARASRLKLYYKPFPIQGHARAMEAALAAEWAREAGVFWKMYDALFAHPHELSDEDLADRAEELGGDPTGLRAALASAKVKQRVAASQAEARSAGLQGTPTLFFNGRRYVLTDLSAAALEATLQDEEEWAAGGGWARD